MTSIVFTHYGSEWAIIGYHEVFRNSPLRRDLILKDVEEIIICARWRHAQMLY